MDVPRDAAGVLTRPSPIQGGVEAIETAKAFTDDIAGDCRSYKSAMRIDVPNYLMRSESVAIRQVHSKVSTTLLSGAGVLERSARDASNGFKTYASEVDRIHGSARNIRERVQGSLDDIRTHSATIEDICSVINTPAPTNWRVPPPKAMPRPVLGANAPAMDAATEERHLQAVENLYAPEWWRATYAWQSAYEDIESGIAEWKILVTERRSAERALMGTLAATEIGQLIMLGSVPGGAGPKQVIAHTVSGELWGERTVTPRDAVSRLFEEGRSPEEIAALWKQIVESGLDIDAFVEMYSFELANLDGIPFAVMDRAARTALEFALDPEHPENLHEAFQRLGFEPGARSLDDLRTDLQAVRAALGDAEDMAGEGDTVQLVDFGQHDGAATAGISMGDLDTASTVGVFVSGMNSSVRGIADAFDAFDVIRGGRTRMAMVTWIGYRSPGLAGETTQSHADEGALELASFLNGVSAQRANTLDRFVLLGHSYGTNVGAEALKRTHAHVDAFVTIGSAGLQYGTTANGLGVSEIHATNASRDNIAQPIGQHVHFRYSQVDGGGLYEKRVDPRDLEGAREFTSEKTPDGEAVTMHNLVNPIDWPNLPWWVNPFNRDVMQDLADTLDGTAAVDEIGYLNPDSSTVNGLRDIMVDEWS